MAITINSSSQLLSQAFGLQDKQQDAFAKISSALKINSAADDAAGLAIAVKFTSQINAFDAAISNVSDGISLSQTGSASLSSVTDSLQRIRELALQAGNSTLDSQSRKALENEANALRDEISRVSGQTNFNGQKIIGSNEQLDFQLGANAGETSALTVTDIDEGITAAGVGELDFSTVASASSFLTGIDDSLSLVSSQASAFGAFQNSLVSASNDLSQQRISATEARSRIEDTDFAKQAASLVNNKIQQQAGIAVQAQANANQSIVNQLLG
ncbi:MAG: flagellin-like protein [Pseudomonadales bacterium]|nr:flagellin-like protein [Pseudomonadales bacterium]